MTESVVRSGVSTVSWKHNGLPISVELSGSVGHAAALPDGDGVAIVFNGPPSGVSNARVYDPDGAERVSLAEPVIDSLRFTYYSLDFSEGIPRVILSEATGQLSARFDPQTGAIFDARETR